MSSSGFSLYQSKPNKVEAWKFNQNDSLALSGLSQWVAEKGGSVYHWRKLEIQGGGLGIEIKNSNGKRFLVREGEYIVKGLDDIFYCLKPEVFLLNFARCD